MGMGSDSSKRASARDFGQTTPTGCITAVFRLFDLHHFHFPLDHRTRTNSCSCFKPDSFLSPHATPTATLRGAEAPRNSVESEEEGSASASASLTSTSCNEEENLNIPMRIQIKTSGAPNNETCSAISTSSSSPVTKTPTLIARLMGLDLLPESRSPSSSSSSSSFQAKSHLKHHIQVQPLKPFQNKITSHRKSLDGDIRGTRSLPETPRVSSARRSDVDHHHRLSLQINKENLSAAEESVISRLSSLKRKELKHDDENRSPRHYARQIVKQVKQSVSRKVGMDITNTVQNRKQAREELVSQFKYKKISRALTKGADDSSQCKHSTPSCSPRLRFLESKSKAVIHSSTQDHDSQPPKSSFSSSPEFNSQPQPMLQPVEEEQDEHHKQQQQPPRTTSKSKTESNGKFGSRLKKPQQTSDITRNKQEEPFVSPSTANRVNIPDKKCRKIPVKKDPSPPATKIPQKQVLDAQRQKRSSQLSSCSSQTYNKREAKHVQVAPDNNGDRYNDATSTTTTTGDEAEHEYIARILRRTGLDKDTPVSFTSWFSPSHPLDPAIFYSLEHFTTCSTTILLNNKHKTSSTQLSRRCNRKLMFHLVDEILIEILKPYFNMKPWVITAAHDFSRMDGCQLIDILCSKVRSFPQADCRVLEDIDALIDKDLPEMRVQTLMAYEEEGEGIVTEIEENILEALLHETADFAGPLRVST